MLGVIAWIDGKIVNQDVVSKERLMAMGEGEGEKKFWVRGIREGLQGIKEHKFMRVERCRFPFFSMSEFESCG